MPLLISAPLALAALPAAAQAGSVTLNTVGCGGSGEVAANEWTVPPDVSRITVVAKGEQGSDVGGDGARLVRSVNVTPGTVYYACVGVGGGSGGAGPLGTGGDGGGYTSISNQANGDSPLMIAAGGGGGGTGPGSGRGGDAGTASNEAASGVSAGVAGGGRRSDENGGGTGGVNSADDGANGTAGLIRVGGTGGAGVGAGAGGGGGGAGVFGGGGGAGSVTSEDGSAGGGGGYSYCDGSCTSTTESGGAYVEISWVDTVATTTTVSLSTSRAISQAPVTLRAAVSPIPSGGTVTFTVDGHHQWNCDDVPVDTTTGAAECQTNIPGARGAHNVRAVYSGVTEAFLGSHDDEGFTVYDGVPSISPSPTAVFGDVELGKSTTRPITVTNVGDADLPIEAIHGIYISEYRPRAMPPRSTEFTAADDQCSGRTLAVGASCVVVVRFTPSALGERTAEFEVYSDSWDGVDPVLLTGVGIEPRPETREPETRQPETRQPEARQPETRQPETRQPETRQPEARQPETRQPTTPTPTAPTPPTPRPIGASVDLSAGRGAQVTESGDVRLPLVCPPGQACRVSGQLTLATTGGSARAAAATKTRVLVRFSGIRVAAGKTKTLSLKLPASFVKAQQAKGVRKLRTTLTVKTTLGNGRTITRRQAITLLIPRARVAQRAAPKPQQRPSFTG